MTTLRRLLTCLFVLCTVLLANAAPTDVCQTHILPPFLLLIVATTPERSITLAAAALSPTEPTARFQA